MMQLLRSFFSRPSTTAGLIMVLLAGVIFISGNARMSDSAAMEAPLDPSLSVATFAAGCFWCTESLFQETEGVTSAVSGYAGGEFPDPTYEQIIAQITDHREAVQVTYDPQVVSYDELVDLMLQSIDPTDPGGQFVDRGFSYTTAIFYHDDGQRAAAEAGIARLSKNEQLAGYEIATKILPYTTFYEAEEYHQDFYLKSQDRYNNYTDNSGRKEFQEFVW